MQHLVTTVVSGAADPGELAERLTIVATELAGNALRHGRAPAVVAVLRGEHSLLIDVALNVPGSRPVIDEQRASGDGGLGLVLAQRLAEDVGWFPTSTGKRVWAPFPLIER